MGPRVPFPATPALSITSLLEPHKRKIGPTLSNSPWANCTWAGTWTQGIEVGPGAVLLTFGPSGEQSTVHRSSSLQDNCQG